MSSAPRWQVDPLPPQSVHSSCPNSKV
jgi:hypothetical protein